MTDKQKLSSITLQLSESEYLFIWDLVNSCTHPTTKTIRDRMERQIREKHFFLIFRTEEIKICDQCKGSGQFLEAVSAVNYDREVHKCHRCNGKGRRVKITTWRLEPLTPEKELELAPRF